MTKFTITSPPSKGNLKLLVEPGSKIGKVLQSGDEFTRLDVQEGRLCYIGVNGVGRNAVTVREDSFGYTIGTGPNKRFGQISIRVEDFLLARTGDPSVPGSEIPIEPNQESFVKIQLLNRKSLLLNTCVSPSNYSGKIAHWLKLSSKQREALENLFERTIHFCN